LSSPPCKRKSFSIHSILGLDEDETATTATPPSTPSPAPSDASSSSSCTVSTSSARPTASEQLLGHLSLQNLPPFLPFGYFSLRPDLRAF
jgi:hypothetical protein